MPTKFTGKNPNQFFEDEYKDLVARVNAGASIVVAAATEATPVGVSGGGGGLRGSWVLIPATLDNPVATIGQSRVYFLPVELGRRPGKGISRRGQESVELWAKRKLGLTGTDAASFAFNLSQKYKREGRLAQGFLGLAKPGSPAPTSLPDSLDPVPGSVLENAFKRVEKELGL